MTEDDARMTAQSEIRDGYMYVRVTGTFDQTTAHGLLRECVEKARANNLTRIVCDGAALEGFDPEEVSIWDHLELTEFAAHALPKDIQLAVLETPRQLIGGRVGEDAMVQHGAQVRVTADLQEALDWLGVNDARADTETPVPPEASS
jgi:hypothetical protein